MMILAAAASLHLMVRLSNALGSRGPFLAAACVLLTSSAAYARRVRWVGLPGAVSECEIIVVGTVTGTAVQGTGQRPCVGHTRAGKPYVEEVEVQTVSFRAELVLKGPLEGSRTYRFRHWRFLGPRSSWGGSCFFAFERGSTYLLFLERRLDGAYEAAAPEQPPVRIDAETLARLDSLPRREKLAESLVGILVAKLEGGRPRVWPAIWMLSRSRVFQERLQEGAFRDGIVKALVRITESSDVSNDVHNAYTLLGQLNVTSVVRPIVDFICGGEGEWTERSNAIGWLQGFPPREQIKAFEEIVARADDAGIVRDTRSRLEGARRLAGNEELYGRTEYPARIAPSRPSVTDVFRLISVEFVDAPLGEAVEALRTFSDADIVLREGREAVVNVWVHNRTLGEALWRMAQQAGLDVGLDGHRAVVASPGSLGEGKERFEKLLRARGKRERELGRIEDSLAREVSFDYVETPLREAVAFLRTSAGLDIFVDPVFIKEKGEPAVTVAAEDLTAGRAVEKVARAAGLDAGFVYGAIFIAEPEKLKDLWACPLVGSSRRGR